MSSHQALKLSSALLAMLVIIYVDRILKESSQAQRYEGSKKRAFWQMTDVHNRTRSQETLDFSVQDDIYEWLQHIAAAKRDMDVSATRTVDHPVSGSSHYTEERSRERESRSAMSQPAFLPIPRAGKDTVFLEEHGHKAAVSTIPTRPRIGESSSRTHVSPRFVRFEFINRPSQFLSVGQDVMTPRDQECWIFASPTVDRPEKARREAPKPMRPSPMTTFEVVPVADEPRGVVGLRSMSSGRFVRVVPPQQKNGPTWVLLADAKDLTHPKKVTHFRLDRGSKKVYQKHGRRREVDGDGDDDETESTTTIVFLFAIAANGYVNLPADNLDDVRCHGPRSLNQHQKGASQNSGGVLLMQQLTASEVEMCKQAVARSSSRLEQSSHPSPQKHAALKKEVRIASKAPRLGGLIAVGTAVTSKGTRMSDVTQSPFFTILLPSFLETFSPNTISHDGSSRFRYRFYVGCDAGDRLYDSEAARKKFSELFVRRVGHHRTNGFDDGVSKDDSEDLIGLRLMSLEGTSGAPSWAVAALMKKAYDDGADWLFQLNDDARLLTLGWELRLTGALASNQVTRLLGVTGPTDLTNPRIFTHVFVHRTHLEIHGSFFPPAFRNYYSDDWISAVYGTSSTFRLPDVKMKHETKKQKTGKIERYKPDMSARKALGKQVEDGTKRVLRWLRERGQDPLRFPLDSVCGFVPLAGYSYVISRSSNESLPSENDGGMR